MLFFIVVLIAVVVAVFLFAPHAMVGAIGGVFGGAADGTIEDAAKHAPPALAAMLRADKPELHEVYRSTGNGNITLYAAHDEPHLASVIQTSMEAFDYPSRPIMVYYYGLPVPKVFSNDGKQSRDNINSAVCLHGVYQTTIYVYREEEAGRVLLHELLHASSAAPARLGSSTITVHGKRCTGLKLDEAWVDALATYIYCAEYGADDSLRVALRTAHTRVCTILQLCGMTFDEFLASKQPTNIREYYLIKYLILEYLCKLDTVDLRMPPLCDVDEVKRLTTLLVSQNNFAACDTQMTSDLSATR